MSFYLTETVSIGVRGFITACKGCFVPVPQYNEDWYCYTIDSALYETYRAYARALWEGLQLGQKVGLAEVTFLQCWMVISEARLSWYIETQDVEGPHQPLCLIFG